MSGYEQHDWVGLESVDNQATIRGLVNPNLLDIDFPERQMMLEAAQEVLRMVAWYTEHGSIVQRVCNHPAQIIALQKQITNRHAQRYLPPQCDHTEMKTRIQVLMTEQVEARSRPAIPGADEEQHQQKELSSALDGSVRVDAVRQSHRRHPSGGFLSARHLFHGSHCISPSIRSSTVSSRSVCLLC